MTSSMGARKPSRRRPSTAVRVRRWVAADLLAVSDHPSCEASAQPAALSPVRGPPMVPPCVPMEPALLVETAHARPAIVAQPLQEGSAGLPGSTQDGVRAAAHTLARSAEPLSRQRVWRGTMFPPQAHAQREAARPVRPHPEDNGKAIPRRPLQAGKPPSQAFARHGNWVRHHRLLHEARAPFADEPRATSEFKASVP